MFEGWLMAYNVAYAFERTPFYRPWLSWVGVDVRRLGIEDLVSVDVCMLWPAFNPTFCSERLRPWAIK